MNDLSKRPAAIISAMLLIICAAAQSLAQSPYRSLTNDLTILSDAEARLFRLINNDRIRRDLAPLSADPALSSVARLFSEDMSRHGYIEEYSPRLGTVRYQARRAGVSSPDLLYMLLQLPTLDDFMEHVSKGDRPTHLQDITHIGIGVASTERGHHVTLVFARSRAAVREFPAMVQPGESHPFSGRLAEGLADPKLFVARPDGGVSELEVIETDGRYFMATVEFRDRGEYTVQLSATGELGVQIVEALKVYCGVAYPPPPSKPQEDERLTDLREAERSMLRMVNNERRQRGLNELSFDESLASIARGHSSDMIENNYFAHVSPTKGDLAARIRAEGINLAAFGENLARNRSLIQAHQSLMDSPQHRMNILSGDYTMVGIGILKDPGGVLYITQVFGRLFEQLTPEVVAASLLDELNQTRVVSKMRPLAKSAFLDGIALENSQDMMRMGRLSADTAQRRLSDMRGAHGFNYSLTQVLVIAGAPTMGDFELPADANPARFSGVGIGVVGDKGSATTPPRLWITIIYAGR